MKIFVAYPYKFNTDAYRDTLRARFANTDVEFLFADEKLENSHVLSKIRDMMTGADTCMFDISESNPNVMLELGVALGEGHPGFVAIRETDVGVISADVAGWDQLRYSDANDLATKLGNYVGRAALPTRPAPQNVNAFIESREEDARSFFDTLFISAGGLVGQYDLVVHPAENNPHRIPREKLRDLLRKAVVSYEHGNVRHTIPYDFENATISNFVGGVQFVYQHPEWSRYEAGRLRTNGLYRIQRTFREDYNEKATIDHADRQLWIASFIEQFTALHLLAAQVGRTYAHDNEQLHVEIEVSGLLNRIPLVDDREIAYDVLKAAHSGTERRFRWSEDIELAELEATALAKARNRLVEIFWTFDLPEKVIDLVQPRLLVRA